MNEAVVNVGFILFVLALVYLLAPALVVLLEVGALLAVLVLLCRSLERR